VQRHKREGKPVQAVKIYREATGVGLREAKAAVDAL
jgi:ribosomal protein L7/L12